MVDRIESIARVPVVRRGTGFYQDAWRRLRRNRAALLGLLIIAAFALAAIPARYALERGQWAEAAALSGGERSPRAQPRDDLVRRRPRA